MKNVRVEEFLDLFKQLERLLEKKYAEEPLSDESVVVHYENSREGQEHKEILSSIRKIRNVLQHNPKINGEYIVTPSVDLVDQLRQIVDEVEHPKLAIDFGVKANQIFKATLSSGLVRVIKVMKERGFSHVPIIENEKLYGVLSAYTVFEFVTEQGMQIITGETKIGAMKDYLPIRMHKNEYYLFMPKKATFTDADEAFEKRDNRPRRLVAIFITATGSPDEPILAMLTPWSVVGK